MSLVQATVLKLQKRINNIDKKIDELKQTLNNINQKYDDNIQTQNNILIDEVLDSYDFPVTQNLAKLHKKLDKIQSNINQKQFKLNHHETHYDNIVREFDILMTRKKELVGFINKYENDIKNATNQTNILKESQISNLFDNRFNINQVAVNKLQQRKQYLIQNNNFMARKKLIKHKLRCIDKQIKDTYWKIVEVEIKKNDSFKQLSIKLKNDRYNIQDNINREIYKHLDIPINKILNQDIYLKFQNDIRNITKSIEKTHNFKQLKQDLVKHINEYKSVLQQYNDLEEGKIKPINIGSIYSEYKKMKLENHKLDNELKEFDIRYNIVNDELTKYKNEIEEEENKKKGILKQIDNYKDANMDIIEQKIAVKMDRFIVKNNIKRRKELNDINIQIDRYEDEKRKIKTDMDNMIT